MTIGKIELLGEITNPANFFRGKGLLIEVDEYLKNMSQLREYLIDFWGLESKSLIVLVSLRLTKIAYSCLSGVN